MEQTNLDRFELEGHEFEFDPARRDEVWVLPPIRRWAPKPQPETLWQRLVQGVREAVL